MNGALDSGSPLDKKVIDLLGVLDILGLGGVLVDVGADARVADAKRFGRRLRSRL